MKEPKKFYLCDKKYGACSSWKRLGWTKCMNEYCEHTTNAIHAKIRTGHHFILLEYKNGGIEPEYWEIGDSDGGDENGKL